MGIYQNITMFDAQTSNTTYTYDISHTVKKINLDIIGTSSPDGTLSFTLIGFNGTETVIEGTDYADSASHSSITSVSATGQKLLFEVEGWQSLKFTLTGMTTGSLTAYLVVLD